MGKVVGQLAIATSLGEGESVNSEPEKCWSENLCSIILLLSALPKIMAGSTQAFTTINKSCVYMYLPTPLHRQDVTEGEFLSRV